MVNSNVTSMLDVCNEELSSIEGIRKVVTSTSTIMMFLTRYSLIKVCGTIEIAYKTIISDFCETSQSPQVKNFIAVKVRNSSDNPTLDNMYRLLNSFDSRWSKSMKEKIKILPNKNRILSSLDSLNDARNEFAHGGNPSPSFDDVVKYFKDACEIIQLFDEIVNTSLITTQ